MIAQFRPLQPRLKIRWAGLLVILIAAMVYGGTLSDFFAASDSLPLIQTGRLQPGHTVADVFSEQIMPGTTFAGVLYRPISILSFDLDYALWGLNPFGYHLTNLLLHLLVTWLMFTLAMELTRRLPVALTAALLFACHPILVETVPAIARRQDILDALFLLLAFAAYLRGRRRGGWVYPALSVLAFGLALGAKETGILIPGLIFAHAFIMGPSQVEHGRNRWLSAVRATAPYLVLTGLYLIWRVHVLGGIGTDDSELSPLWIAAHYFTGLFYPQDFLGVRDQVTWAPVVGSVLAAVIGVGILAAVTAILRHRKDGVRLPLLLVIWLLLPLPVLMATGTFAYRSLYPTVIPFSLLLGLILERGYRRVVVAPGRTAEWALFSGAILLAGSLLLFSPLVRDYPLWHQSGQIARQVLATVSRESASMPATGAITVEGLPQTRPVSILAQHPRAHSVSYLRDYSIQAWLALQGRDRNLVVHTKDRQDVPAWDREMALQVTRPQPGELDLRVVWEKSGR